MSVDTQYELLDDGVRVTVEEKVNGIKLGRTSYMVTYHDFKEYLQEVQRTSKNSEVAVQGNLMNGVMKELGTTNRLMPPENCIEVTRRTNGGLDIRQLVSSGTFGMFTYKGRRVDTSRFLIDFTYTKEKRVEGVSVSTFRGLVYGKHTEQQVIENKLLTEKLKREFEGRVYDELMWVDTKKIVAGLTEEEIKSVPGNRLVDEMERVATDGGTIRWEEFTW